MRHTVAPFLGGLRAAGVLAAPATAVCDTKPSDLCAFGAVLHATADTATVSGAEAAFLRTLRTPWMLTPRAPAMRTAEAARLRRLGTPAVTADAACGDGASTLDLHLVDLEIVVRTQLPKGAFKALLVTHWLLVHPIVLASFHRNTTFFDIHRILLKLHLPQKLLLFF